MRIRRDPVTVIGDETRDRPLAPAEPDREGAGSRTIREPGDLPGRRHPTGLRGRTRGDGRAFARISSWAAPAAARAATRSSRPAQSGAPRGLPGDRPRGGRRHGGAHRPPPGRAPGPRGPRSRSRWIWWPPAGAPPPPHDVILVDCAHLWVANLMERGDDDAAVLAAADDLAKLQRERVRLPPHRLERGGRGRAPARPRSAAASATSLGFVNQRLAAAADRVTLMVAGIPAGGEGRGARRRARREPRMKLPDRIPLPDPGAELEARRRLDQLTKPPGASGGSRSWRCGSRGSRAICPPPLRDAGDLHARGRPRRGRRRG